MPAEFVAVGVALLSWGATYLLHSTCLVGGVWLLFRVRPHIVPAVRETLWKTALVGGLITTPAQLVLNVPARIAALTLTVPMGNDAAGRPDTKSLQDAAIESEVASLPDESFGSHHGGLVRGDDVSFSPELEREMQYVRLFDLEDKRRNANALPETPSEQEEPVHAAAVETIAAAASAGSPKPVVPRSPPETLLIAMLAIGAGSFAVGLCRHLWQSVTLRRRLAGAHEVHDGPVRDVLDELCRTVPRSPGVRLLSAPHCFEPAAFGLRRWTIVLPAQAERDLSPDELRSLLAHELAHLVRGDMWWLLISRLLCSCGGFQPLNHLARREWQRAAEYLCDAWAVSRTGNRLALARCLTEVASWRLSQSDCAASLAATGSRSTLADRIECLVDGQPIADPANATRVRRRLIAAAIVVLAGLIGSGMRVNLSIAASFSSSTDDVEQSTAGSERTNDTRSTAPDAETSSNARPTGEEAPTVNVVETAPATIDSAETHKLYEALDEELRALQRDLADLHVLLKQTHVPAAAGRLAELLQRESTKLEERRAALNHSLSNPPGERGAFVP